MSTHAWEKIAEQIEQETDPHKIAELSQKLNEAMMTEEREKVAHRIGLAQQAVFVPKNKRVQLFSGKMSLHYDRIELASKGLIACRDCHIPAVVNFGDLATGSPIGLEYPNCLMTLGQWNNISKGAADMAAFIIR